MWKFINFRSFRKLSYICKTPFGTRNFLFLEKVKERSSIPILSCIFSTLRSDSVKINKTYLTINHYPSSLVSSPVNISFLWLRDHCRCSYCYNHYTNQRIHSILDVSQFAVVKHCLLENNTLHITWIDNHISKYQLDWLLKFWAHYKAPNSVVLWNGISVNSTGITCIDMKLFMEMEIGLKQLLMSLILFGVGFVKNVPTTKVATQQVVERISHIQNTFFGTMWEFSDSLDHQDTAYSHDALSAHTDNTYFSEAAGLQVFHCLYHNGTGGETLLVDGFHAANCLKQKYPSSYKRLTETSVDFEYKESGRHYLASGPILRLDHRSGELEQIRFNMYDRASFRISSLEKVQQFYEDLYILSSVISDSTGQWWFKLNPGTVLFINNWRILHGRASYTGHRKIAGCYVGHSDWCSKARILGLL